MDAGMPSTQAFSTCPSVPGKGDGMPQVTGYVTGKSGQARLRVLPQRRGLLGTQAARLTGGRGTVHGRGHALHPGVQHLPFGAG
ncbi:hypothetical protein CTI14_61485, partial [Methylobacterium radiotolerans]